MRQLAACRGRGPWRGEAAGDMTSPGWSASLRGRRREEYFDGTGLYPLPFSTTRSGTPVNRLGRSLPPPRAPVDVRRQETTARCRHIPLGKDRPFRHRGPFRPTSTPAAATPSPPRAAARVQAMAALEDCGRRTGPSSLTRAAHISLGGVSLFSGVARTTLRCSNMRSPFCGSKCLSAS